MSMHHIVLYIYYWTVVEFSNFFHDYSLTNAWQPRTRAFKNIVVRDGNDITNEVINSLIYSLIHD